MKTVVDSMKKIKDPSVQIQNLLMKTHLIRSENVIANSVCVLLKLLWISHSTKQMWPFFPLGEEGHGRKISPI
jgi:hypothetical protein